MKAAWASVVTAAAASICCIGPVAAVTLGAGTIGAAAVRFEPLRPAFLAVTFILTGLAFYGAYRHDTSACAPGSTCAASSRRRAKWVVWVAGVIVLLLVTFPYYIDLLP